MTLNSFNNSIRKNASQDAEGDVTEDEKTALKREHRTWQLIRAVLEYVHLQLGLSHRANVHCDP